MVVPKTTVRVNSLLQGLREEISPKAILLGVTQIHQERIQSAKDRHSKGFSIAVQNGLWTQTPTSCPWLAVWPWKSYLTSLCLMLLICEEHRFSFSMAHHPIPCFVDNRLYFSVCTNSVAMFLCCPSCFFLVEEYFHPYFVLLFVTDFHLACRRRNSPS